MYFHMICRLNFPHMVPSSRKRKEKRKKIKNKILKKERKKRSEDTVDRYLSPKFGVNLFSGVRENEVYRRWTTNTRLATVDLGCVLVRKNSFPKMLFYNERVSCLPCNSSDISNMAGVLKNKYTLFTVYIEHGN